MALYVLFGAWRIFVRLNSLIVFVETWALNSDVHTNNHSFDTMNFCRIAMMVATGLRAETRNVQQVEGRREGKGREGLVSIVSINSIEEGQDLY